MEPVTFTDEASFEKSVIDNLKRCGWDDAEGVIKYPTEQDLIGNWARILFNNNRERDRLNDCPLTSGEMRQIMEQIADLRTPLRLNAFINGKTVSIIRDNPDDKLHLGKSVSMRIYDRREIAGGRSRYQIVRQPKFNVRSEVLPKRRGDLMLLINGMPVIHIELKKSGVRASEAYNQIEKYAREGVFTGLFSLVQVFVAMNPDESFCFANPGPSGEFNRAFRFHWADFNNEPKNDYRDVVHDLLSIPMAHQLIGFYTVADAGDGALKVMRSYQYYAASAISNRVAQHDWSKRDQLGGYIWHTTGSGKTMTSFKSAQLIADSKDADKVVFLMDRIELGTQSLLEYRSFADDADDVQGTENTGVLKEKLESPDPKNTLIVTSIQKMSNIRAGEGGMTQEEVDRLAARRIVFVIDECHRSTFGDMLQDIRRSFPNALYFGFTGTPILDENQKKGSTTAMIFGDCIHRYSIADGIRDGNVLGFDSYMVATYRDHDVREAVALERAKANNVIEAVGDPRKAEVFYHYMDSSKVPMGPMATPAGERIRGIEDFLSNAQYGVGTPHEDAVVDDVIEQFPVLSRGNKFHAILATSSIPEAISYYRIFKRRAPQLRVTALFDPSIDNDGGATVKEDALKEIVGDYNAAYGQEFTVSTWPSMKKDISARLAHKKPYVSVDVRREERIDLLIVVDQMLTGFDSKWVNTLYLDKVIDYENVIQAFSRTNRIFGHDKPFGVIRYYRKPHTMRGFIEAAVKLYSGDRPLDLFVCKLPENIALMDARLTEIEMVFKAAGVPDFSRLPGSVEARRKFAKDFVELNGFLEAARVQGFSWEQDTYQVEDGNGDAVFVQPTIDERTYLTLVQRYKELFAGGLVGGYEPSAPYDLDSHITEIDTGHIDVDYMNANFTKWLKALGSGDEALEHAAAELHRSFATLTQEEQRYAEVFLHDVERGDVVPEEGKTLRDYITSYARRAKDSQFDRICEALGCDRALLVEMCAADLTEDNLNEYGRFDRLKDSIDGSRARAYLEEREGKSLPLFKVNLMAANLLKRFVLDGGVDVE